jgi:hypothetical protein
MSDVTRILSSNLFFDLRGLFTDYQLRLIADGGQLWPDATPLEAQCFMLANSLVKKYNDEDRPSKRACKTALEKFIAVNQRCDEWALSINSERDAELVGTLKQILYEFWYYAPDEGSVLDSLSAAMHRGDVGSGSSCLSRAPDYYTKLFDGPLTCTRPGLLDYWRQTMTLHPLWSNAERTRHTRYGESIVAGNVLSFVNKNVDTARCISTEPTINMWYQLGVGNLIRDRMKEFFHIDLETQPALNGELARIGSSTGLYSTIDLESASDSMSMRMARVIFPKGMLQWLELFRSPVCRLPGNRMLALNMVSTMGNGYTSPLQTLLFSCVVAAVYKLRGIDLRAGPHVPLRRPTSPFSKAAGELDDPRYDPYGKHFGVFGDDIIVDTAATNEVIHLLELIGFVVNRSKTHVVGPFRESCGSDWYNGTPCRGIYIKRLGTAQDHYVAINTLNRWSAMTLVALPSLVGWLRQQVSIAAPIIPFDEDDAAGIKVPIDLAPQIKRGLYGTWKYRKDVPCFAGFRVTGDTQFNVQIVPETHGDGPVVSRRVNRAGLLLSFLGGYMTGGTVSEAKRLVRYRTKHALTPHWDYFPITETDTKIGTMWRRPCRGYNFDFAAWSAAVTCNLY